MSSSANQAPALALDLSTCDREPIHIPGSIQPHGFLLALNPADHTIVQASENVERFLGRRLDQVLGHTLSDVLPAKDDGERLLRALDRRQHGNQYLSTLRLGEVCVHAIAHQSGGLSLLEFELAEEGTPVEFSKLYPLIQKFLSDVQRVNSVQELAQIAVNQVRELTGFARVLLYRFDPNWHGHVLAEAKADDIQSYLDLWFPASDIPAQARELYRLNRLRLIADATYQPVRIQPTENPLTRKPLDLSFSTLRSVSPIHLEYLANMGVVASMSISILREGQLWGLISCHDPAPKRTPYEVRTACDFLGQALTNELAAKENREQFQRRIELHALLTRLLSNMAGSDQFVLGLTDNVEDLLAFANANGAAVLVEGQCRTVGNAPPEDEIRTLVTWLVNSGRKEVFHTDQLDTVYAPASAYREIASGLLAISISKLHDSHVLWFRKEVVQTVKWSGDPTKAVETGPDGSMRIHPRKSFEMWRETVSGHSLPWQESEIEAAVELRNAVVGIVLRKAEELAELTEELQRSNKELEAFSYSVSHDLRAPFRHIVGYSELLREHIETSLDPRSKRYIETIIESAQFAGSLVDNLLNYSRIGRSALNIFEVNADDVVRRMVKEMQAEQPDRPVEWKIGDLGKVHVDGLMFRTAMQNLLSNALKYSRNRTPPIIEISRTDTPKEAIFRVSDNGVGFNQKYVGKLFGVFQRLHRVEDFEGTGIGLANVRRIANRHGGTSWAEGEVDKGAAFYFSIPHRLTDAQQ